MPNKPLEWTGRRRVCLDSNSFLPATQGQRSEEQAKAGCCSSAACPCVARWLEWVCG